MQLHFDVTGQLSIKQRVELLKMPAAKRKRLSGQLARKIRVNTRRRLREQKDIKGRSWAARKGKNNRKMMRGFSKRLTAKGTAQAGTVGFDNYTVARTARAQQEGVTEVMSAAKMEKIHGQPDYEGPATRAQAKALRAEGYKVRKKSGKGFKNATIKSITENLTLGQAGIILRMMRDKDHKTSWVIPLPARSFLGASEKEIKDMVQTVFNQTTNAKTRG